MRIDRKLNTKIFIQFIGLLALAGLIVQGCLTEKTELPFIPPDVRDQYTGLTDVQYILLNPKLDTDFSKPADVYLGVDNFVYVCDTGNDRIVMLDVSGQIQGVSGFIPHPEAITQNDSLQLLIVNKTNTIYLIDLVENNHQIASAEIKIAFIQENDPDHQFTGITIHNGFEYYVTVINVADTSAVRNASFIYDFNGNHSSKGPLPLFEEGTGLFSALIPTSIVSLRERWLDISANNEKTPAFIFTQKAQTSLFTNNFKVQFITTRISEGDEVLSPNISYFTKDFYDEKNYAIPEDVTLDRSGFIFVIDQGNGSKPPTFYRFSSTSGNIIQKYVGDGSNGDDITFNNPKGIAVLPDAERDQIVYVADTGNDRILMFKLSNE
jgi:DNA-binding beta-propeller fold protein YncE